MQNIPQVKLGIVAVSRDCFPKELSLKRRRAVVEACKTAGIAIAEAHTIVENERDALKALGLPFPITSGRYRSMTSDYITPMDRTIEALGPAPYSNADGVKAMVQWYDDGSDRWRAGEKKDARITKA